MIDWISWYYMCIRWSPIELHLSITEMYYMIAWFVVDNNASYVFSLFSGSINTPPFTQNCLKVQQILN